MIGILIGLIISWLTLYVIEKKSLLSLGLLPVSKRLKQWVTGFLITAILCVGVESLAMLLKASGFRFNENYSVQLLGEMFWWDLRSVLTEELIFRGALLYILIERLGTKKGILLSAAAFGVYHWFSFGIIGNVVPMIVVFIGTGLMGYAWALAFAKTRSVFMPIGLHLGWNFTFNTIFSKGPLGNGLIIEEGEGTISDWFSLVGLWGVPIIVLLIIIYLVPLENNEVTNKEIKATADMV